MNKPTLDKVRDYFYGRCNDGEEVRLQQWFADNGNSSEADRLLGTLLDEVRSENPALAQAAFEEFCRRIGHSVPARTAPRRLTTVIRWTQRIAAVLIVPLLIAVSLLYTKTAHTPEWEEVLVPAGQRSELRLADGTLLWLNSGTRVTYPTHFNGRQRKIFVDGEVYAEVMHGIPSSFRPATSRSKSSAPNSTCGPTTATSWSKWRWSRAACVST